MSPLEIRRHFKSPWSLIEHAGNHLSRLKDSLKQWDAQQPFEQCVEYDPDSGMNIYKLRLKNELPGDIPLIAYDVANSLRSALDHAAYASAVCFGAVEPKKVHFPFADSAEGVDAALDRGNSANAPPDIKPLLRSFEPYESGNSILWALNKMRNTKTHAVLLEPSIYTNGVQAFPLRRDNSGVELEVRVGEWDPVTHDIEILRVTPGQGAAFRIVADYYIAASDVELLRGRSIVKVFAELRPMIHDIVRTIEAETIRLLS